MEKALREISSDREADLSRVEILRHIADSEYMLGNSDQSIEYYNQAENYLYCYKKYDGWILALYSLYIQRARLYVSLKDFKRAVETFTFALDAVAPLPDCNDKQKSVQFTYYEISQAYANMDDIHNRAKYFEKVDLSLWDESDQESYTDALLHILYTQDKYSEVIEEFNKAKDNISDQHYLARAYFWVANAHYYLKNINEAESFFQKVCALDNGELKASSRHALKAISWLYRRRWAAIVKTVYQLLFCVMPVVLLVLASVKTAVVYFGVFLSTSFIGHSLFLVWLLNHKIYEWTIYKYKVTKQSLPRLYAYIGLIIISASIYLMWHYDASPVKNTAIYIYGFSIMVSYVRNAALYFAGDSTRPFG
ncbi:MAG: tetratricopeptide repeat protein [FCB group bacterium]|nr:tetratricopeptide repeat protein [FCB group bacterium]